MKLLILGGSGMLGHRLWLDLGQSFETWATLRSTERIEKYKGFDLRRACYPIDVLRRDDLIRAMAAVRPDCVINCVGLIKQLPQHPIPALELNSLLPHQLAQLCAAAGSRLIHVSTDCVFTGATGHYSESDPSDATDLYGRSKALGEVTDFHCLTLRTSIIGRELETRLGLIEWFLGQTAPVKGYRRAIYTGVTTDELARVIRNHVVNDPTLSGLYQVASAPISKYDLLLLARDAFHRDTVVEPDDSVACDRSLKGEKFRAKTGYTAPAWREMLTTLGSLSPFYE